MFPSCAVNNPLPLTHPAHAVDNNIAKNMTSDPPLQRRLRGSKSDQRGIEKEKLVESVNALSTADFFTTYEPLMLISTLLVDRADLSIRQGDATDISHQLLEACLNLIEKTSRIDYENSELKWSASKKRKEMKLPDMKYIILTENQGGGGVAGFISFMVTYEDGYEVLYIYEIHFTPERQGQGLGRKMMKIVEVIGQNVGVAKVMLTVFRANYRAVDWYTKLGYQEDEFTPGPRKLRNGTLKEPSYIILSKPLGPD